MVGSDISNGPEPDSATRVSLEAIHDEKSTPEKLAHNQPEHSRPLSLSKSKSVLEVTNSEIGVKILLNRLKQSIASAKEFALFLKKLSVLEEEHSVGLRKLCRTTVESIKKPDHRDGSFLQAYIDIANIHEQMAENGTKFAISLHQMHDDLLDMAIATERTRKQLKLRGISAEQKAADAQTAMEKSKHKYDALADDYTRAVTGDRQAGKLFGLKGPKTAAQNEELLRKFHAADGDYATKVKVAQNHRAELWSKTRPSFVKSLEELIRECDSALTLQMQKFASFNERLFLSNGLNIHPIKDFDAGNQTKSLKDVVNSIDNDRDLNDYLTSFVNKIPPTQLPEIEYRRHSILNRTIQRQSDQSLFSPVQNSTPIFHSGSTSYPTPIGQQSSHGIGSGTHLFERNLNQTPSIQQHNMGVAFKGTGALANINHNSSSNSININRSPQLTSLPFRANKLTSFNGSLNPQVSSKYHTTMSAAEDLPPLKPVFGISLDVLFERDCSAVPMIVYQCIQAVDLFGLEVEGIYRLSGTASQVTKIKSLFDNDASKVDFRDPANFFHDVNSVAGLLKQFFRDLPDPLLTSENYLNFINAAKNEDDILRRDSLHAIINSLPDPNYATLRAVILHLNRVQNNSGVNRMNISNLAIVFGPTLMGANTGSNIENAGWQVKVIDTILKNCYQIFDDD